MFEHRQAPLLSRVAFAWRMMRHGAVACGIVAMALSAGVLGYHCIEGMPWIDSILNASMILGGMGPVGELHSAAGKLFASAYALFAGLLFILIAGILFAPIFHRFLHRFHLDRMEDNDSPGDDGP